MKKILQLILMITSVLMIAQKAKVTTGSFANVKSITSFDLKFDYTNVKVDKFATEDDFLADKMKKREEKGSDQDFKKSWFSDREERYEPKFIESYNKRGDISVGKNTGAKYVMEIKTTWIYPGYNVGVVRKNAKINATVIIYDKNNPNNVLVSADYKEVEGYGAMGYDYNSGYRISEAYAKLAKVLAENVSRGK